MQIQSLPNDLAGLAAVSLLLGVRHGFDADHLATIDGLTRAAAVDHPGLARACGAFFALGHGAIVVAVAGSIGHATTAWNVPQWLADFGAWVSIGFLVTLGLMNIASVLTTPADRTVSLVGLRARLLTRLVGSNERLPGLRHPLAAAPTGALFAISFDTLSQVALFSTAASRVAGGRGALACAVLFTAGMLLTDGINGLWLARLLRRKGLTARIASRVVGLGVGAASLLVAATGVLRQLSSDAGDWLDRADVLLSIAVIAIVLGAMAMALRRVERRRRGGGSADERSRVAP